MTKRIYLDNNASTFIDPRVSDDLCNAIKSLQGNPSSTHSFGQHIRNQISKARSEISSFLGVKPTELVFTSGGTESLNMVIRGIAGLKSSGHLITSSAEHSSVFATVKELEESGFHTSFLEPGPWGAVNPEAVKAAIRPDTLLITLMAVNNETGVKTDFEAIAAIAKAAGIPFVVDGVALMGKELFTMPEGVSAMCFSGHKFHAPQGTGFAFIRSGLKLKPLITGGEQEFGRRPGTENVIGILAMSKAIQLLSDELPLASEKMFYLRDRFENTLQSELPGVYVNGDGPRTVNVSNLAFEDIDGETLLMALDTAGVAASHGSACSSGALEPSRILLSMGLGQERVRSSLRFSLSRMSTEQEIDQACQILIKIVRHMRSTKG